MANRKISDLTALTAPATGDLLPIVDISEAAAADKNKKITYGELLASAPAGSAAAPSFSFDADPNTGIFNPAADTLAFVEGGAEAMRIDSSGNVGVGVTPNAWGGGFRALQMTAGASFGSHPSVPLAYVNANSYFDGTANRYIATSYASRFLSDGNSGGFAWQTAPSGTAGNVITYTQAMTLDASGRLGVGTTSPGATLHLLGAPAELRVESSTSTDGYIRFTNTSGSMSVGMSGAASNILLFADRINGHIAYQYLGGASGFHAWNTNNTERARLDSSGRLLVGTSTDSGGALLQVNGDRVRVATAKTPASATATGTTGEICWDASYIYVCTATNTWKRTAIATW
jgi:hypothetical protein